MNFLGALLGTGVAGNDQLRDCGSRRRQRLRAFRHHRGLDWRHYLEFGDLVFPACPHRVRMRSSAVLPEAGLAASFLVHWSVIGMKVIVDVPVSVCGLWLGLFPHVVYPWAFRMRRISRR